MYTLVQGFNFAWLAHCSINTFRDENYNHVQCAAYIIHHKCNIWFCLFSPASLRPGKLQNPQAEFCVCPGRARSGASLRATPSLWRSVLLLARSYIIYTSFFPEERSSGSLSALSCPICGSCNPISISQFSDSVCRQAQPPSGDGAVCVQTLFHPHPPPRSVKQHPSLSRARDAGQKAINHERSLPALHKDPEASSFSSMLGCSSHVFLPEFLCRISRLYLQHELFINSAITLMTSIN